MLGMNILDLVPPRKLTEVDRSEELSMLTGVTERITGRRKYRVTRRNRLRHRAPRFDNRRRLPG
jgi:hypothetical protein